MPIKPQILCPTCRCRVEEHGCTPLLCGLHGKHRNLATERGPGRLCPTCGGLYESRGCTNLRCRVHPERKWEPVTLSSQP